MKKLKPVVFRRLKRIVKRGQLKEERLICPNCQSGFLVYSKSVLCQDERLQNVSYARTGKIISCPACGKKRGIHFNWMKHKKKT